jgi:hypothetical protein
MTRASKPLMTKTVIDDADSVSADGGAVSADTGSASADAGHLSDLKPEKVRPGRIRIAMPRPGAAKM